jgi:hypothetical protein
MTELRVEELLRIKSPAQALLIVAQQHVSTRTLTLGSGEAMIKWQPVGSRF